MKLIIFLLFLNMNDYNFEDLIGKSLKEVNKIFDCDFKNNLIDERFYYSSLKDESFYYGFYYNFISLNLNEEQKVESITIHFKKIIDLNFYNLFINHYEEPSNIIVVKDKKIIDEINEENNNTFNQKIRQSILITEEGSFEDKPLYILWEKKNFKIKILMRYEQNICDITFSGN